MNWKQVEELPGYEISEFGDVKNLKSGRVRKYHLNKGYLRCAVSIDGKRKGIYQHKIVMRYHNEEYRLFQGMKYVIDHINSIKTDNRIENLRVVSNRENTSKERTIKSCLPTGVQSMPRSKKNPYMGKILINGKDTYLGLFPTAELASQAYQKALKELNKKSLSN